MDGNLLVFYSTFSRQKYIKFIVFVIKFAAKILSRLEICPANFLPKTGCVVLLFPRAAPVAELISGFQPEVGLHL